LAAEIDVEFVILPPFPGVFALTQQGEKQPRILQEFQKLLQHIR
jgi:hypothetical protein